MKNPSGTRGVVLWKGLLGPETLLLVSRFSAGQGGSCCIPHSAIEAHVGPLHCVGLAPRLAQGRWEDVDGWAGPPAQLFPPDPEVRSLGPLLGPPPRWCSSGCQAWLSSFHRGRPGEHGISPSSRISPWVCIGDAHWAWDLIHIPPPSSQSTDFRELLHGTREGFRLGMELEARWRSSHCRELVQAFVSCAGGTVGTLGLSTYPFAQKTKALSPRES